MDVNVKMTKYQIIAMLDAMVTQIEYLQNEVWAKQGSIYYRDIEEELVEIINAHQIMREYAVNTLKIRT